MQSQLQKYAEFFFISFPTFQVSRKERFAGAGVDLLVFNVDNVVNVVNVVSVDNISHHLKINIVRKFFRFESFDNFDAI